MHIPFSGLNSIGLLLSTGEWEKGKDSVKLLGRGELTSSLVLGTPPWDTIESIYIENKEDKGFF